MPRSTFFAIALALALLTSTDPSYSQDPGEADLSTSSSEEWRQDIEHLRRRAPEVHADLFHTLSAEDWNRALDDLSERVEDLEPDQIVVELAKIVAAVGDGHTDLYVGPYDESLGFHQAPIRFYRFEDGIRVQAVRDEHAEWLGARLASVGGIPIENALERIHPILARDNEHYLDTYAVVQNLNNVGLLEVIGLADGGSGPASASTVSYGLVLADGSDATFRLAGEAAIPGLVAWGLEPDRESLGDGWSFALDESVRREMPRFRHDGRAFGLVREDATLYVDVNLVRNGEDQTIEELGAEIERRLEDESIHRLVFDLRDNGGGNNTLDLPLVHAVIRNPRIDRPDRLFVLIGRHTFSAASHLVTAFERHTNATFVGEPTGASPNHYGDAAPVVLPHSGLRPLFSGYYWQNSQPWERRDATEPDLAAPLRWSDYVAGHDAALATIDRLGGAPRLPEVILEAVAEAEAGETGADDPVVAAIESFLGEPAYRYVPVRIEVNRLGYRLLREERTEDAVQVFRANTELFPESANAFDSLGEALYRSGEPEKARNAFERAVALDPDGRIGSTSRSWLARLGARAPETSAEGDRSTIRFEAVPDRGGADPGGTSRGVAWGDFTGDGYADLVVANTDGERLFLYRNLRGERLEPVTDGPVTEIAGNAQAVSWVDFDNDGDLDLFVGRENGPNLLFSNDGQGGLSPVDAGGLTRDELQTTGACWSDFDGDGWLDVFVVHAEFQDDVLYRNDGTGAFETVAGPWREHGNHGRACAWSDIDRDGDFDLYVANAYVEVAGETRTARNDLYRNRGDGTFDRVVEGEHVNHHAYSYGVSFADYDDDGDEDLFASTIGRYDPNFLFENVDGTLFHPDRGSMVTRDRSGPAKGHAWGDFDNDGDLDLFVAEGHGGARPEHAPFDNHDRLYENLGGGEMTVSEAPSLTGPDLVSAGTAAADFDRDGDLDLFVANWGDAAPAEADGETVPKQDNQLFRNVSDGGGWIELRLAGTRSNRMGVGAHVRLTVGEGEATRHLHRTLSTSTGFGSMHEPVLHFGLGPHDSASEVEIRWPSGAVDRHRAVASGRRYLAREGGELAEDPPAGSARSGSS